MSFRYKWGIGMRTCPRDKVLIVDTIKSLLQSGWHEGDLYIKAEPGSFRPNENIKWHINSARLGSYQNFLELMTQLRHVFPEVDFYVMCEDDFVSWKGLRLFLEQSLSPAFSGVYQPYISANEVSCAKGWQEYTGGLNLCGALFYIFPSAIIDTVIHAMPSAVPDIHVDGHFCALLQRIGVPFYFHRPSLIQHTGDFYSTLGYQPNVQFRTASDFIGIESSLLTTTPGVPAANEGAYKGWIDKLTRTHIDGWALHGDIGTPVSVFINDQFAGITQPSIGRPDVAKLHGVDPWCGFHFEFSWPKLDGSARWLEDGDVVSARFMNGSDLPGSPLPAFVEKKFDFGDFRLKPITDDWGFSRGNAIDRHYIEQFLDRHAFDIRGHVLEVGSNTYTLRYGGSRVIQSDVLDIEPFHSSITIVADLTDAEPIPAQTFDCVILTHVLPLIREAPKAISTISRILKPGGVALITVPGISQISSCPNETGAWSWSFYPETLRWLLSHDNFDDTRLLVEGWGNCKTAVSFLAGLSQEDLEPADFDFHDPQYPLTVTARAVKKS